MKFEERRLFVFLFGLFAPKHKKSRPGGEPNSLNDDEELEKFLNEQGFQALSVRMCSNPCGCIFLVAGEELVWAHHWSVGMNC